MKLTLNAHGLPWYCEYLCGRMPILQRQVTFIVFFELGLCHSYLSSRLSVYRKMSQIYRLTVKSVACMDSSYSSVNRTKTKEEKMSEWRHYTRKASAIGNWKAELETILNTPPHKNGLEAVCACLSAGDDFHVWAKVREPGDPVGPDLEFAFLPPHGLGTNEMLKLLSLGRGIPVQYNVGSPAQMWVIKRKDFQMGTPAPNYQNLVFTASDAVANGTGWPAALENWLNSLPIPTGLNKIWCALSGGNDFHMFVEPGQNPDEISYLYQAGTFPNATCIQDMVALLNRGEGKPLGFNVATAPQLWYIAKVPQV
ncbi:hypothetical protein GJ700_32310 [Duganella sp. FT92W]|uniref:Uncharacterized protein n=1 Tax=Pseudoduganella rivuli TaxID=2666085 RepID=A0A7X2IUK9_9BURK|nr:hypothetical protein [Pseudoduganella rivuli]MRV76405.1 hypothetical protein [Pseudoduganella rivuli]